MFDWENAIALPAMQGNRASSRGECIDKFYLQVIEVLHDVFTCLQICWWSS